MQHRNSFKTRNKPFFKTVFALQYKQPDMSKTGRKVNRSYINVISKQSITGCFCYTGYSHAAAAAKPTEFQ